MNFNSNIKKNFLFKIIELERRKAIIDRQEFLEDCIAEMAMEVYKTPEEKNKPQK